MVRLGTALYASRTEIKSISKNVGATGIAGLNCSKHRAGIIGAPKISTAASIFDMISKKNICLYENTTNEEVYIEGGNFAAITDGKTVFWVDGSSPSMTQQLLPLVLFELSKYSSNDELIETFETMLTGYDTSGFFETSLAFKFCDSFYYGYAKDKGEIEVSSVTPEEVAAAFRSGLYEKASIGSKYMSTSRYDKPVKVKKKAVKSSSFIDDCKAGKYRIPYEWDEDMKARIIDIKFLDTFEPTEVFEEIVRKIKFRADRILERMDMGKTGAEAIGNDVLNILVIGKPGTGKTTLFHAVSAATGMPIGTTVWTKHSDEDEVEGKTKIVEGNPSFVETYFLDSHIRGGININEEINLADPAVTMGGLGQQLEYPYIVKKNGYETVTRHPLCVEMAAMNVGTNGSKPLSEALLNRFKTPFTLNDPTKETFIAILEKSSGKSRKVCEWVYRAYESSVDYLQSPEVNEEELVNNLSIRTCLGAISNMEEGQTPVRALINSIVGTISSVDLAVGKMLQREKIECLPNPEFE